MKLINTLFLILISVVIGTSSLTAQNAIIGSGTTTNGTTTASPINTWFRSSHHQIVYTAAELQAAGAAPGQILQMGWYVDGAPLNALPNYTISMKGTTATDASTHDGVGLTQVYNNALYAPTVGGWDMLTLSTPFLWNGVDNILVDICWDQVNPTYNASGQLRTFTATNGARYSWSDVTNQCGLNTATQQQTKAQVNFFIQSGPPPSCANVLTGSLTATNVTGTTADINWTADGTPVSYILEYGITGFLPGAGTSISTTATTYNLMTLTPVSDYTVRVQQVCGTAVGDTSYATTVNFTTPCVAFVAPFFENFAAVTTPSCWEQSAITGGPWVFTGNPGYAAAGTQTHTADGSSFAWVDFSGTDDDVILEMPIVDVSGLNTKSLSFWFRSEPGTGNPNNVMIIQAFNGSSSWVDIGMVQQDSPNWENYSYNISQYVYGGSFVKIRFIADRDPVNTGSYFFNDLMLDDVSIDEAPPHDAGITGIISPSIGGCTPLSNAETVILELTNFGSDTLTSASLQVSLNGGLIATETFTGMILPGASQPFTLTNPIDLTASGTQDFEFNIAATPVDDVPWNNISNIIEYNDGNSLVTSFPYTENFDSWNFCFSDCNNGICGDFGQTSGWRNTTDDDSDWSVTGAATPTMGTGPDFDHTTGSGNYLFTEANGCTNFELITPCFDFSTVVVPEFSFWYHMNGGLGTLSLQADTIGNGTWVTVWSLTGSQGNSWQKAEVTLNGFNSYVTKFRFFGATGGIDMAIDDIRVGETPANDAIVTAFLNPTIGGCNNLTTNETVTVELGNLGLNPITSAQVQIRVNNVLVGNATFTGNIAPNGNAIFTFPTGVDLSAVGQQTIKVKASALPMEDEPENDESTYVFYNDGGSIVTTYPYTENFDSWATCLSNCDDGSCATFGLTNGWRNSVGDDDSDWSVNTGATVTTNTGPSVDHTSGNGKYLYTEANGCTDFFLISPCFDFTAQANPEISFWYHMNGANTGTLSVEVDSNGTGNWISVWSLSGSQVNTWQEAEIDLTAYAGTTSKLRFNVATGGLASDIAIDDILMRNVPTHDLQVTYVDGPDNGCGSESVFVDVTVFNYGANAESNYTVSVDQTGLTNNTLSTVGTVTLNDEDSTVVMVGPFNTAAGGVVNYAATVTINNATDDVVTNNIGSYAHEAYALSYPQAIDGSTCGFGEVQLGATGIAGEFFWFESMTSTNYIDTGFVFNTPYLYNDTVFYIEGRSQATDFMGPVDNTFEEGAYYDYYEDGLVFDAHYDMTLDAVKVYPLGPGDITINITDPQGAVLFTTTYNHTSTVSVINIPVGFFLEAGNGYQINALGTNVELYRNLDNNNAITTAYPYQLNDAVSITGSINSLFGAYYFFYDWEVTTWGCPSARIPVTATVAASGLSASFVVNDDPLLPANSEVTTTMTGGQAPYTFNWSNGAITADLAGLSLGTYYVTVEDAASCLDTFSVFVNDVIGTKEIEAIEGLNIFPNPSNGDFNVKIELDGIHEVSIDVVNTLGQVVYSTSPESISARQYPINLDNSPSGIYQIRIRVDKEFMTKTILVNKRD
jgi:hypothetical protein